MTPSPKFLIRDLGAKDAPAVVCFVTGGLSHNWALVDQDLVDNGLRVITFSARFTIGAPYEAAWDGTHDAAHYFGELRKAYDPTGPDFDAPYSFLDCVADFTTVLDQVGLEKASVLGFSTGGVMAQIAVTHFPERVISGVCCASPYDPNAVAEDFEGAKENVAKNAARMANAPKPVRGDLASVIEHRVVSLGALMEAEEPENDDPRAAYLTERAKDDFENGLVDYAGAGEPRSALAWALWVKDGGLAEHHARMERNQVPTLIVHGKADPLVPFGQADVLHSHFANSELLTHDYGHMLGPAESQRRLTQEMAAFIKESP